MGSLRIESFLTHSLRERSMTSLHLPVTPRVSARSLFAHSAVLALVVFAGAVRPHFAGAQAAAAATPTSRPTAPTSGLADSLPVRLPAQLVQDFHSAFGAHHARAVHTKGVILQGQFEPSAEGRTLSRATVFTTSVPIIVRFSDFTGIPDIPDTSYNASPRGFAIKFLMPDGSNLDIVTHSFNGFLTHNSAEFSEFLRAIGASGPDAVKPTTLDKFLATHPVARHFLTTQKPPPASYATAAYFGVNAFQFSDAAGHGRYVRYRFVPESGEHYLDASSLATKSPTYLIDEIVQRVTSTPVRFTWYAQLAETGDVIDDPSVAWPEGRTLVKLGVLTIDRAGPNTAASDQALAFQPGSLLSGIEIADPMVTIRNAAYPVSFHERQNPR